MGIPHVVVVPYPAQGHVIPMLEISQWLVKHGIKVTCVNTDFNHHRVVSSSSSSSSSLDIGEVVNMVSIPDGLEPWEDRTDLGKLTEAISRVMPGELEALITTLNRNEEGPKICCVIADWTMAWALDVAERMGLRRALFCPAAAATLALCFTIPQLIRDGSIDDNGQPLKNQMIHLLPGIPPTNSTELLWACVGDEATQKITFHMLANGINSIKKADIMICNSSHDLEAGAFSMLPELLPIGPLLASNRLGKSAGYFWPEDSACLAWLDQQPPNSVIYVAFGSFTVLDLTQFEELALGLELTDRPFLWVVRPDITAGVDRAFPAGFEERVGGRGRVVGWAPQQQVLSHPSVACFVTHCGWNSTIEGISNGVPFLCWPYFAEQFTNRNYICDEWKVGLGLSKDGNGIISRGELKEKVELLLGDGSYKERILDLGGRIMDSVRGGSSHTNFSNFVNWIKAIDHV